MLLSLESNSTFISSIFKCELGSRLPALRCFLTPRNPCSLFLLLQEFYRLRSSLRAQQLHASLLQHFRDFDPTSAALDFEAPHSAHASISRNSGQMDSVISQAQSTLGVLVLQRSTFGGINSKISNVSSRLPTVNQILASIKRKKSIDTLILSLVASVCAFLIFIYWLSK